MNSWLFFGMFSLSAVASAGDIYKCTEPNGFTVFQQFPCDGGRLIIKRGNQTAPEATTDEEMLARQKAKAELRRQEIEVDANSKARSQNLVVVGMSEAVLIDLRGRPDKYNDSYSDRGLRRQMIYETDGRTLYVYVEDGKVVSISDRENYLTPPPSRTLSFGKSNSGARTKGWMRISNLGWRFRRKKSGLAGCTSGKAIPDRRGLGDCVFRRRTGMGGDALGQKLDHSVASQ